MGDQLCAYFVSVYEFKLLNETRIVLLNKISDTFTMGISKLSVVYVPSTMSAFARTYIDSI